MLIEKYNIVTEKYDEETKYKKTTNQDMIKTL